MKKYFQNRIATSFLAIVFALVLLPSGKADAQYCDLSAQMYGWLEVGSIRKVTLNDLTEGTQVYERASGYDMFATVDVTGTSSNPIEMNIGNEYELNINWGIYYQGYLRVFLDRNGDGRWDYVQMGPDQEYIGNAFKTDRMYYIPPIEFIDTKFNISINDAVQEGPGRLRLITNYSQYNVDPCTIYYQPNYLGYGEAEDYAINFVASLPDIYPTTGNILYNKESYDGTTRDYNGVPTNFKLPSVQFKGPQPVNTRIEYTISGPLPSREVVYTALDPATGSNSIRFTTPTQTYSMKSAIGSASVSPSVGSMKFSKGGEYVVNVKVTKANGKSSEGSKVFTVANNYDMSVATIESPRTSRAPRFFKYLVNTNIGVTTQVQNTGLNPINRFEVTAKIYNAATNTLVGNLPKYVFDTANDPNLIPLQAGQKLGVDFPAFQTPYTGEYYIKFEVFYTYDQEVYNNTYPRPDGDKYYFEVQYNDQLAAGNFQAPLAGQVLKVNKPTAPRVVFLNNGISDASNINFHMVVKNEAGMEVFNEVSFLEDLPQGRYNSKVVTFPNMIIREPGTYRACAWVDYPYDNVNDDDTTCITFEVEKGIQDTITVGDLNAPIIQINNDDEMNSANDEVKTQRIDASVVDFNFNGFSVNPANTTTAIRFNSKEALTIEVVDMNGNVLITDVAKNNQYNLDVSKLANGAYTVLLRSANGIQSRQLSVVR